MITCGPGRPTGAAVNFDYNAFIIQYPEFGTSLSQAQAQTLFSIATIYHRNDCTGPIADPVLQLALLNMVVAHLAYLQYGLPGLPPSPIVGRISQASQGSVSVSTDYGTQPASAAFWIQTKYGAMYWSATLAWRTMRYVPGPRRVFNPFPPWYGGYSGR